MSKDTLQLPKTAFSMKASLPTKEPEILKKWVPLTYEAFEDYRSDSFQLSKEGTKLLKDKLANKKIKPANFICGFFFII